jgi:hypothetical protein
MGSDVMHVLRTLACRRISITGVVLALVATLALVAGPSGRASGSVREPRPGSCCLYAGHRLGSKQVSPRLIPGQLSDPGSDVS